MGHSKSTKKPAGAYKRLSISVTAGLAAGLLVGLFAKPSLIPLAFWDTSALIYIVWMWLTIWPLSAEQTKILAKREDPGKGITDIFLNVASIASLVAVALILIEGSSAQGAAKGLLATFGVISVILSWAVIHTLYTLKYAELYYADSEGGVDFNQKLPPRYSDFAYLSFTVGMTFQVSDTNIQTNALRRAILHQAQLSYFFGTIIIATTINLVVGLSK